MLSDKNHIFFFFKEDKIAINEKKYIGYLEIFIHHYKNTFIYIKKTHKHQHI